MEKLQNLQLKVDFMVQGKSIVAYSSALDISTVGKNREEAKKRFVELVNIFFEELIEAGTLNDVLKELGWKKNRQSWSPPKIVSTIPLSILVPSMV